MGQLFSNRGDLPFLITHEKIGDALTDRLRFDSINLGIQFSAVTLIPLGNLAVVLVELNVQKARPVLENSEVLLSLRERSDSRSRNTSSNAAVQLLEEHLLGQSSSETPVEESSGVLPCQWHPDRALGFHTASAIVEIGELKGDLLVDRSQ